MIYEYDIVKKDYVNAGKVSSQMKQMLKQLQVNIDILRRIAVACYEAEINMIIHSDGGKVTLKLKEDGILHLQFDDVGPGISNLEQAMTPGYSTADEEAREFGFGAGMGLVNIKKMSDEFAIESSPEGTHISISFHL